MAKAIEYSCSLGHFFYRKVGQDQWIYINNKEVVEKLEEYEKMKAKKSKKKGRK